jgi:hypothetical protein
MDEVTKLLKSLSARMERIELKGNQDYRNPPNDDNRGKIPTNSPQTIQRDQRGWDRDYQIIQAPLQNNLSLMKKKRKRRLILKSIVLGIPPHFPFNF